MREEFSAAVKRVLGERVAYRCSYNGCGRITIGPSREKNKSICTGEAAHIYGASPNGPRSNPAMSPEQKSSIDNGIWMCKNHARLIDVNEGDFTPDTLALWKTKAENYVYERLEIMDRENVKSSRTLIMVKGDLIFEGEWISATDNIWSFKVFNFIEGDLDKLKQHINKFEELSASAKFVIVESQGDGRPIKEMSWKQEETDFLINCVVMRKEPRVESIEQIFDIAIGDDGDLILKDGDIAVVRGIDAAVQSLKMSLEFQFGWWASPQRGSYFKIFYDRYKNNIPLLNRLIKVEMVRMLTVKIGSAIGSGTPSPTLDIVDRVHSVEVLSTQSNDVPLHVSLEWGNGQHWSGDFKVLI